MFKRLTTSALALLAFGPSAFALPYTGDVTVDFGAVSYVQDLDPAGDVGLASNAPPLTVSGWDLDRAVFNLDLTSDQLNVGLEFFGIAGDADGNGGEGTTSPWLAANGGLDLALLAQTEAIVIAFDFDQNGSLDVIAGDGAVDGLHRVSTFTGSPFLPAFGFGPVLPAHQGAHFYAPSAVSPDYELTLDNISGLATIVGNTTCFDYLVFTGSYQDDGVGEDLKTGTICITDDGQVLALDPAAIDLVQAYPNPFNPSTTLSLTLGATGPVELAVFNLGGQRVKTLVNGSMSAGAHEIRFDAASLPSGLYLARLVTENGTQVTRLILSK